MSSVMYNRREGQPRVQKFVAGFQNYGLINQEIDARKVTILQPREFHRIKNSSTKRNYEQERLEQQTRERGELHAKSKELVKHWENTIEGQRLKKLQARKIREEEEELERQKVDIEEAKLQAEQRKEAIIRAKQQQYYQTDRVKGFHGALLLTEVLKEREAQLEMKKVKENEKKERDAQLLKIQTENYTETMKLEKAISAEKFAQACQVADFQLLQLQCKKESLEKEKEEDKREGKAIKENFEVYEVARRGKEKKQQQYKSVLMEAYKKEILLKEEQENRDKDKEELDNKQIQKFVRAKREMAAMKCKNEEERLKAHQKHTDKLRERLHEQMKQKVDDEDERIVKAVTEREKKRQEKEMKKEERQRESLECIKRHRQQVISEKEQCLSVANDQAKAHLQKRVAEDNTFYKKVLSDKRKRRERLSQLQLYHKNQVAEKYGKMKHEKDEQLLTDSKNRDLIVNEEEIFQAYAKQVIEEAKVSGRDPFLLVKAAREGQGGGRGPKFEGNAGLRPNYIVSDATGVQLPHCTRDHVIHKRIYGHVGKSGPRLGFTW